MKAQKTSADSLTNHQRMWTAPPRWMIGMMLIGVALGGIGILWAANQQRTPTFGVEVVNRYPHDPGAFTQGLTVAAGQLYEGTGQYGSSSLRRVDLQSGNVVQSIALTRDIFGEGIAAHGDKLVQLTWKKRRAYVFDRATFKYLKAYKYSGEGWGLTFDGRNFVMSDGSSRLRFMDPETFREVRRVTVQDGRRRIDELNELEFVRGEIWANIWYSDSIARISPETGRVVGWIDLSQLWPVRQRPSREHVLNGIAYDPDSKRLFVTGKNWPTLFEIRVVDRR